MSLENFVAKYSTAQEAYAALLADGPPVINNTQWTLGLMQRVLGMDLARKVAAALKTLDSDPFVYSIHLAISTIGVELHTDDRQDFIDQIGVAGGLTADEVAQVKALGKAIKPAWEIEGLAQAPTQDEVDKAFAVHKCRTDMAAILHPVQAKSTAVNAWLDALDTSTKTVAEVEAYCASLLASSDGNPA